jgi:hypothetical protein
MISVSVADASSAEFPSRKLTEIGGEFPVWSSDGNKIHYSLGAAHFVYDLNKVEALEDSLKMAKKMADLKALTDTAKKAATDSSKKSMAKKEDPKYTPEETWVKVYYKKDIPQSVILLKGARIITMKGNEVLAKGDVLVVNNRIKSVAIFAEVTAQWPNASAVSKILDLSACQGAALARFSSAEITSLIRSASLAFTALVPTAPPY